MSNIEMWLRLGNSLCYEDSEDEELNDVFENDYRSNRRRVGRALDGRSSPPPRDLLKPEDAEKGALGGKNQNRKISLSCLVSSVLSFERGRRRASRAREEDLLQASEAGDIGKVKRLVLTESGASVNINCTDPLGRTPLHLAVANEQKEVVQFLLSHVDKKGVYQALMLAINLGHDEIAEMIIEHPVYEEISAEIKERGQAQFFINSFYDDNQFTEEVTPLILAAQQNRFEIVMALLMKGEEIQKPHKYQCPCTECGQMAKCDELKFARSRLNAYKGLSSEAYISLSSDDPVLTSFELRQELKTVSSEEKYYAADYKALSEQLASYVVKLLDKVHGNEELDAILNAVEEPDDEHHTLPRLQLAIEYQEKKFVAHPSCQKKLTSMWYADFADTLKSQTLGYRCGIVALISVLYPALALIYMISPNSKVGALLKTPIVKFVAHATSFIIFLCLVLTNSYVEQTKLCSIKFLDDPILRHFYNEFHNNISSTYFYIDKICIRNYIPSPMEVCIAIWIAGLLWQEIKQVHDDGIKGHFGDIYNHVDFFMIKFYISSFTLRQLVCLMTFRSLEYFQFRQSWEKLVALEEEAVYRLYWLNADRFYWDAWDPYHVCEALFAIANILNFTRLFYLLVVSDHLGPMLISLSRMIKDVMKFFTAYVPILIAFNVGLYNMYWYYLPSVRKNVEVFDHGITTKAEVGFGDLELTFRTIFWALFGLSDSKLVQLQGYQSRFTESVGYIVFGVYNWGAVIVLLNMLIAMMTRSFEKITIHKDIEWKFARSKLYMEYIAEGSTLPVPFNIIPTPKSVTKLLQQFCAPCQQYLCCCKKSDDLEHKCSLNSHSSLLNTRKTFGESDSSPDFIKTNSNGKNGKKKKLRPPALMSTKQKSQKSNIDYKATIKKVVRRYIFEHLQASVVSEGSTDGNHEALRQEFHTLHNEIGNMKPKVQTEFDRMQADMVEMKVGFKTIQASMNAMTQQLENIVASVCPATTNTRHDQPSTSTISHQVQNTSSPPRQDPPTYTAAQHHPLLAACSCDAPAGETALAQSENVKADCVKPAFKSRPSSSGNVNREVSLDSRTHKTFSRPLSSSGAGSFDSHQRAKSSSSGYKSSGSSAAGHAGVYSSHPALNSYSSQKSRSDSNISCTPNGGSDIDRVEAAGGKHLMFDRQSSIPYSKSTMSSLLPSEPAGLYGAECVSPQPRSPCREINLLVGPGSDHIFHEEEDEPVAEDSSQRLLGGQHEADSQNSDIFEFTF